VPRIPGLLACALVALAGPSAGAGEGAKPGAAPARPAEGTGKLPEVVVATLQQVQDAIRKPGARAVLVNVWATFCDPCRDEMPDLLRVFRARQARGLRLVLVSADPDDEDGRTAAARYLATLKVDFPSYVKTGDDMAFIDGLDRRWSGALPASFLFDGQGKIRQFWSGQVTAAQIEPKIDELLTTNASNKGRNR
jgi:thiol-disulfide isomerase/thioredoxin